MADLGLSLVEWHQEGLPPALNPDSPSIDVDILELDREQGAEATLSTVRDGEGGLPHEHFVRLAPQLQGPLNLSLGEAELRLRDVADLMVPE